MNEDIIQVNEKGKDSGCERGKASTQTMCSNTVLVAHVCRYGSLGRVSLLLECKLSSVSKSMNNISRT